MKVMFICQLIACVQCNVAFNVISDVSRSRGGIHACIQYGQDVPPAVSAVEPI